MSAPAVPQPLAQLPNALTVLRLVLVPVFCVLLLNDDGVHAWGAAAVFAIAGVTDQVDGWLARRWHVESKFGKVADPLADRLMIDAAVIILAVDGRLPWAAAAVILARDVFLFVGYRVLTVDGEVPSVSFLGKLATWVLYAALVAIMITGADARWPLWLFWTGLGLALAAAVGYARWAAARRRYA